MRSSWSCARVVKTLLAGCALLALSLPAWSQLRTIPANGKRAVLTDYENPFVVLSGDRKRLAPGAVIFDTHNRMILPGYLPDRAEVVYTTDQTGQIMRIYLLTPEELKRLGARR